MSPNCELSQDVFVGSVPGSDCSQRSSGNGYYQKTPVSLVITDVMMPKMDGCELCRAIKTNVELCGIPVVMLTAKNTVEARLEGYMAGAEEYIEKPFSMKYLSARIAGIVDKKKKKPKSTTRHRLVFVWITLRIMLIEF